MLSFENTEIAFKSKTNKDLSRAYWLFKIIGSPKMVRLGKWFTNLALKLNLPIRSMVKKTIFRQFCGGEHIDECDETIHKLGAFGIGTILDYSVEGQTSSEAFEETTQEIISTIEKAKNSEHIPFAVFKVTGISRFGLLEKANKSEEVLSEKEQKELSEVKDRVRRICGAGHQSSVPVFIDAEESWIQDVIDRMAYDMMLLFNKERAIVYNTLQMYRHDRLDFLGKELDQAKFDKIRYGVKLVRGAYMEKERARAAAKGYPSPIQPDKNATDKDFDLALKKLVENIDYAEICAGTHNENSSRYLSELMKEKGLDPRDHRIYFAQLLGMSDHISYNLSNSLYNVAKYVPYGPVKEVMPYLLRRADENTSVKGQTGRELSLIITEKKRRKEQRMNHK
ncbi:MAG: proline dehydrogenase [Bacteroidetes bacterium]|nr:MAG: proline dehydrogenase [Bacteroidota bacterium]